MDWKARHNNIASQHIEVALVYKDMLGLDEARSYLEREHIPAEIAERILSNGPTRRRPTVAKTSEVPPAPQAACRRRNGVHDAIVEAALKIERKLGTACALAVLKEENLPPAVIERVLGDGPRQLRCRQTVARLEGAL